MHLSETEIYTWEFLEANHSQVLSRSITYISEQAHVSAATVVRTLKKRGFDGYTDYKNALKYKKPDSVSPMGFSEPAATYITKSIKETERTLSLLNVETLERAVTAIARAKQILIISRGASVDMADFLAAQLQTLGLNAVNHYLDSMLYYASQLTSQDAVIALSASGETDRILKAAKTAKDQGAPVIAITCNYKSRLAGLSDALLYAYETQTLQPALHGDGASRLPLTLASRLLIDLYLVYQDKGSLKS